MSKDIYFYGVDFKKIRLFCKIRVDKIHEVKEAYRANLGVYLNIDYERYYPVISVDFYDEVVKIEVDYKKYKDGFKDEDRMRIGLRFEHIEFSYFFEEIKEEDLGEIVI